jgi:cation-transporting ATPase 13A3/4/5
VIQTRQAGDNPVLGLVKNTGFLTTKGSLIRDILYPKKIKFKFYSDSIKFIGIMAITSLVSILAIIPAQIRLDAPLNVMIQSALNLITTAIPAALPVSMSAGVVFATIRLKNHKIFCISPPRINMAGQIDTFVFDKTGTLTEEGLSILGFRPTSVHTSNFLSFTDDAKTLIS